MGTWIVVVAVIVGAIIGIVLAVCGARAVEKELEEGKDG